MSYNHNTANKITEIFEGKGVSFGQKKMFGGLAFVVDDKMCMGIIGDDIIVRMDSKKAENAVKEGGCRPMDFNGKPLKGYLFVGPEAYATNKQLNKWIDEALLFNPIAKKSTKKKSS